MIKIFTQFLKTGKKTFTLFSGLYLSHPIKYVFYIPIAHENNLNIHFSYKKNIYSCWGFFLFSETIPKQLVSEK